MSKKIFSVKSLTLAHNKVGIVLSALLLMIFVSGTLSVFRPELNNLQWNLREPITSSPIINSLSASSANTALDKGTGESLATYDRLLTDIPNGARVKITFPTQRAWYYRVEVKNSSGDEIAHLVYAASDKRLLASSKTQSFADIVFAFHAYLLMPAGKYVVGIAGLYLLFLLQSGVVIHWPQIRRQLFKFRTQRSKDKWLDLHKLFGLAALPFSYMMALTGAIFTLVLIFQIVFVLVLYKGDAKPLLADAGYYQHQLDNPNKRENSQLHGKVPDFSAQSLLAISANKSLKSLTIYDFALQSSYVQLDSKHRAFEPSVYHIYQLGGPSLAGPSLAGRSSGELIYTNDYRLEGKGVNAASFGVEVMKLLHIGDYGGVATRWLYFALGLCCSLLIYSGIRVWINKQKLRVTPKKTKPSLA